MFLLRGGAEKAGFTQFDRVAEICKGIPKADVSEPPAKEKPKSKPATVAKSKCEKKKVKKVKKKKNKTA